MCCVRNPFDSITSMMHFLPILNQGGQLNEKFKDIPEVWDKLVTDAIKSIKEYHEVVMHDMKK